MLKVGNVTNLWIVSAIHCDLIVSTAMKHWMMERYWMGSYCSHLFHIQSH